MRPPLESLPWAAAILAALWAVGATHGAGGAGGSSSAKADAAFCADVCAAGLGAPRCGNAHTTCRPLRFDNATAAVAAGHVDTTQEAEQRGKPRNELCPQLCPLSLGDPLCRCAESELSSNKVLRKHTHDWREKACIALCATTGRAAESCPACTINEDSQKIATTDIDWDWWCHVLCSEGDGGLACLCDINP